jgi:hypothetical protein
MITRKYKNTNTITSIMLVIPNETEAKAKYDLFFVEFSKLYAKYVLKEEVSVGGVSDLPGQARSLYHDGWRNLIRTLRAGEVGYAMLSDRMYYLIKINIQLSREGQLSFQISPTYLVDSRHREIRNREQLLRTQVIIRLQALGFALQYG